MYEVELISFIDYGAADAYAGFTKVSSHLVGLIVISNIYSMILGGKRDGVGEQTNGGSQSRERVR